MSTTGIPSIRLKRTKTSHFRYSASTSASPFAPARRTRPPTPRRAICSSIFARSPPSPTSTSSASSPDVSASAKASTSPTCPFSGASRPTERRRSGGACGAAGVASIAATSRPQRTTWSLCASSAGIARATWVRVNSEMQAAKRAEATSRASARTESPERSAKPCSVRLQGIPRNAAARRPTSAPASAKWTWMRPIARRSSSRASRSASTNQKSRQNFVCDPARDPDKASESVRTKARGRVAAARTSVATSASSGAGGQRRSPRSGAVPGLRSSASGGRRIVKVSIATPRRRACSSRRMKLCDSAG